MMVGGDGRTQLTLEGLQQDENYTIKLQEIGRGIAPLIDPVNLCEYVDQISSMAPEVPPLQIILSYAGKEKLSVGKVEISSILPDMPTLTNCA